MSKKFSKMRKFSLLTTLLVGLLFAASPALSQGAAVIMVQPTSGTPVPAPVDASNFLKFNCATGCGGGGGGGVVAPTPATSTDASSTIAVDATFQSVFASSASRVGCTLQNNSASNVMYVFFGAIGGATSGKSFQLSPGQGISCAAGLAVLTDQVSIAGTSGDAFVAKRQ